MLRWGSSGGCVLAALFCVYGFIASGEYEGAQELAWRSGYAVAGLVARFGAFVQAKKGL
ncbi:MAG: hypothetical protein H8E37_06445 [Planctomycetes bacterium]|nr:hypothetical protein [Planctomycetota bacterium]